MTPLLTLILALFFIVLGLIGIVLPWSTSARTEVVDFLLSNTVLLSLFGFSFLVMGAGTLLQIFNGLKRRYTTIKDGDSKVELSEEVFKDYLSIYFQELFPYTEVPCQVQLKKRKARVIADLPFVPENQQKDLLKKIEEELSDIFRELIGYRHALLLSISFAPTEKLK